VPVDHVVHPRELSGLLARLATSPAGAETEPSHEIKQIEGSEAGTPAGLVCPLCKGALTEAQAGAFQHFRCHVGHTFSLDGLMREQGEEMERALWAAVRALEEGSLLSRRLHATEQGASWGRLAERARTQAEQAELIRQVLLHGALLSGPDGSKS
jgi:two-component system chemotaxis response regulator CheB